MRNMAEIAPIEQIFDRMGTARNRVRKHSSGPDPESTVIDWRATVNGTRTPISESIAIIATKVTEFWSNVEIKSPDECWPWNGYTEDGYGKFYFDGAMRGAHELAVTFTTGERRDPSLDTCHSCDNPPCCNPSHLRFDTRLSNVTEMHARGRGVVGSMSAATPLTESDVLQIRIRRAAGAQHKTLADDFGVSVPCISAIVLGKNWKHVGGPITNRKITRTRKAS